MKIDIVLKALQLTLCLLLITVPAYGMQSYEKLWSSTVITGPLKAASPYQYYLQTDLRIMSNRYVFERLMVLPGLGYQFLPSIIGYIGIGRSIEKTLDGETQQENRYWQQLNWHALAAATYDLVSRTRLEEIQNLDESHTAYRLRQRFWLRIPFSTDNKYSFSCFDELFFNINHPAWVSPSLIAQNRAFVGIGNQLSKSAMLDIGYMNQYLHSQAIQMNHVLLLNLAINWA